MSDSVCRRCFAFKTGEVCGCGSKIFGHAALPFYYKGAKYPLRFRPKSGGRVHAVGSYVFTPSWRAEFSSAACGAKSSETWEETGDPLDCNRCRQLLGLQAVEHAPRERKPKPPKPVDRQIPLWPDGKVGSGRDRS